VWDKFAVDSPLEGDGFELSVPGDAIKVFGQGKVGSNRSSDAGELCGRRSPATSRPWDERRGPCRPARSSPRFGIRPTDMRCGVLLGQPFHPALPSARRGSALISLFVGASGLSSC
jgi:hypothetical protein